MKAGETELQARMEKMAAERDSTLSKAQELSDRVSDLERERDGLQVRCGRDVKDEEVCVGEM